MITKQELVLKVSARLLTAFFVLFGFGILSLLVGLFDLFTSIGTAAPWAAMLAGAIGGFVGIQRRLKQLEEEDLKLMADSWIYISLAPAVGALLSLLLYVVFVSELMAGELFPEFKMPDASKPEDLKSFASIFKVTANAADYAKLMFWAFIAGFSEKFVTDIIGQFQSQATNIQRS
jgi:hypothetical protein